jgi:hypothetical protein
VRIIDADELVKKALTESCFDSRTEDVFLDLVDSMPTVDAKTTFEAEPVRHGRWIPLGQIVEAPFVNNYRCSECDYRVHFRTHYCPDCGWPMDGGGSGEG